MKDKSVPTTGRQPEVLPFQTMRPLANLRDEIDRLFDEMISWSPFRGDWADDPFARLGMPRRLGEPHADMVEKDDAFEIDLEVPGMKTEDIDIALTDHTLTVRGHTKEAKEEKGKGFYLSERRHGEFARTFGLPTEVAADKVAASLHDGVLTITLPKSEEARKNVRRIPVKGEK